MLSARSVVVQARSWTAIVCHPTRPVPARPFCHFCRTRRPRCPCRAEVLPAHVGDLG